MPNLVKEKLRSGKISLGGWVMIGHPASAHLLASCGFDWVAVDIEHTAIDYGTLENIIRAIETQPCLPLVRLPGHDPVVIKRCLDAGARGLIVPLVNTADQARAIVAAAKYPPVGNRGAAFVRAANYGRDFHAYYQNHNADVLLVAMIEHVEAVENIESIVAVKDIDALFMGPYDLSSSLGIVGQFDHPKFLQAMERVCTVARAAHMPVGFHVVPPDLSLIRKRIDEGYQFLGCSIDTQMLLYLGKQLAEAL